MTTPKQRSPSSFNRQPKDFSRRTSAEGPSPSAEGPSTSGADRQAPRPKPGELVLTACRGCGQHIRWNKDPDAQPRNPNGAPHQCGTAAPSRGAVLHPSSFSRRTSAEGLLGKDAARIRPIEGFVCSGDGAAVLLVLRTWLKGHEQMWKGRVISIELRYFAQAQGQEKT